MIFVDLVRENLQGNLASALENFEYRVKKAEVQEESKGEAVEQKARKPGQETNGQRKTSEEEEVSRPVLRKAFLQPRNGENELYEVRKKETKIKEGSFRDTKLFRFFAQDKKLKEEQEAQTINISGLERIPGQSCIFLFRLFYSSF